MRLQRKEKMKNSSITSGPTESAAESKKLKGRKKSVELLFCLKLHIM